MRGCRVDTRLTAAWSRLVANMFDGQSHALANVDSPLRERLELQCVAWNLHLHLGTQLIPPETAIFVGHRLHEQVSGSRRAC